MVKTVLQKYTPPAPPKPEKSSQPPIPVLEQPVPVIEEELPLEEESDSKDVQKNEDSSVSDQGEETHHSRAASRSGDQKNISEAKKEQGDLHSEFHEDLPQSPYQNKPGEMLSSRQSQMNSLRHTDLPRRSSDETNFSQDQKNSRSASHSQIQDDFGQKSSERFSSSPRSSVYRSVASENFFHGSLQNSSLQQKLQQRAQAEMTSAQQHLQENIQHEVLTKSELLTLFRMRKQAERRDELRKVLRYELARAKAQERERVQNLRFRNQNRNSLEQDKTRGLQKSTDRQALGEKLRKLDGDTPFERVLNRLLEGEMGVPNLAENIRARFAEKTEAEWRQFFANMLTLSSAEVESQTSLSKLIDTLFRGIFTRAQDGKKMLVSDLTLMEGEGEESEFKFSQLELKDSQAQLLNQLTPGDALSAEILKALFGEEIFFLKLEHIPEILPQMTDQQKQQVLAEMRQTRSASAQKKMEEALLAARKKNEEDEEGKTHYGIPLQSEKPLIPPDQPRGFTFLVYAIGIVFFMLAVFILSQILRA